MYLKKLVANGFKSFYSRTEIEFGPDVNAVVGPNGCGKSNIHDAIRWVLGEQSAKQLRGQEISDVIATGNVRRVSKNTAEAYLTFDGCGEVLDTERDEVEIGRRVNQEGEGTYFLNGDEVRLKDIQDLFRDTGLGQSLYSSIGQGEIAGLVESKPEELREIIEEAAGIATYRHRRDLSRRRLEQTREELEGVEKELREKKGRLSQLKGQAERVREVRTLKRRLRRARVEQARHKLSQLEASLEELEERKSQAQSDFEDERDRAAEAEQRLESAQEHARTIEEGVRRLEALKDPLQDRAHRAREETGRRETRAESLRETISRTRQDRRRLRNDLRAELDDAVESHRRRFHRHLKHAIRTAERRVLEHVNDRLRERHRRLKQRLGARETQQMDRQRSLLGEDDSTTTPVSDDTGTRARLRALIDQVRGSRRRLDGWIDRLREGTARRWRLRGRLRRTRREVECQRDERRVLRRRFTRIRDARDSENGEGTFFRRPLEAFKAASRRLERMSERGTLEGFVGVFDRLVDVPSGLRDALRVALGGRYYAVFVETPENAEDLVRKLPERDGTSAVIQPLEVLRGDDQPLRSEPSSGGCEEAVRSAASFVEAPASLQPVLRRWLGDVGVVESLDDVPREDEGGSDSTRFRRWVTPSGQCLGETGEVRMLPRTQSRGGKRIAPARLHAEPPAVSLDTARVRRHLRQRRLRFRRETLEDLLERSRKHNRNQRNRLREDLHRYRERRGELERTVSTLVDHRKHDILQHYRTVQKQSVRPLVESEPDRRSEDPSRLRHRVERLQKRRRHIEARLNQVEHEVSTLRSSNEDETRTDDRRQSRVSTLLERFQSAREDLVNGRREWFRTQRELTRSRLVSRRLDRRTSVIRELLRTARSFRDQLRETVDRWNDTLRERQNQREKTRSRLERVERERANEQQRLEAHREWIDEELELEPTLDRLDDVDTGDFASMEPDEVASTVRELQSTLRDMQPVNMLADRQAEELESEVETTESQVHDLRESCEELETVIERLNRQARQQFMEAFEEIREHFQTLVEDVFRGGDGDLSLTDDPVLEAGVLLELKPPGESLKSLSALSGGEKTMAALAFLFALFERKPTPFCFMDEVDAPLDDDNLHQFLSLLERYRDDTQFLLVTHQKATMQAASRLFGVTMEESGVTSIIPMSFGEASELREPQPA